MFVLDFVPFFSDAHIHFPISRFRPCHPGPGILDSSSVSGNSVADDWEIAAAEEARLSIATDDGNPLCAEDRDDGSVFYTEQQELHPNGAAEPPGVDSLVGDVLLAMKSVPALGTRKRRRDLFLQEALAETRHEGETVPHDTTSQLAAAKACVSNRTLPASTTNVRAVHPADQSLRLPAISRTVEQQL